MQRFAWSLWLPPLVAFLLYLPALHSGLVWDDPLFLNHPVYRQRELWAQALGGAFLLSPNYFRPLAVATFLGTGASPWLHHLLNGLLHALNTALVAWLAARLVGDGQGKPPARVGVLAAGLLYGVHPALVEGVAFIAGRFDLLVTTFLLLALLADHALRGRGWLRPLAVGVAVFCAALCKELAAAILVVLPVWHLATCPQLDRPGGADGSSALGQGPEGEAPPGRKRLAPLTCWADADLRAALGVYLAAGLGLGSYLLLRYAMLGYLYVPDTGRALPPGNLLQHALLVGRSLSEYALLIVWPFTTLRPIHYSVLPLPTGSVTAWLSLAISGGILLGLVWWTRRDRATGALAVAGGAALLPVLNIIPLELGGGAFLAERFLLFPLALLALAVGRVVSRATSRILLPLLGLWVVACIAGVQLTVPHWRSDQTLWEWGIRRAPLSAMPYTNLALVTINQGDAAQGLALAEQALQRNPNEASALNHLGLALFHLGRYAEAEAAFARAVEAEPENALYWNNLAGALREGGQPGEAERVLLDEALRLDPLSGAAHFSLGLVYLKADRPDLAIPALTRALDLLPPEQATEVQLFLDQTREPVRWLRLGDLLLGRGDMEGALEAFAQAEELGANAVDVAVGRSAALIALQALDQAQALLQAALLSAPEDARLYNNLGLVAQARGEIDEARELFERAAELAPGWDLPRQNLERLEP